MPTKQAFETNCVQVAHASWGTYIDLNADGLHRDVSSDEMNSADFNLDSTAKSSGASLIRYRLSR